VDQKKNGSGEEKKGLTEPVAFRFGKGEDEGEKDRGNPRRG